MHLTTIIALISAFAFLIILLLNSRKQRQILELRSKIRSAINGQGMRKIAFKGKGPLLDISIDFNSLTDQQLKLEAKYEKLKEVGRELEGQSKKLEEFESSLSQVNLLTNIGKRITSSLQVEEILQIMFSFVQNSMDAQTLELLYDDMQGVKAYVMNAKGKVLTVPNDNTKQSILQWSMDNGKEVFLNDARADFGQYVYDPIQTSNGESPGACMVIPLSLHGELNGALAINSEHSEVYNSYHLDFLRTIASYLAVALDNSRVYRLLESSKLVIENEKQKSDELLKNILPSEIAEELKDTGSAMARRFEEVSILFTDFKEFTQSSAKLSPEELVQDINHCFKAFDKICEKYGIEKIKTIGDSYMAAGGIPTHDPRSVKNTVLAALEINEFILNEQNNPSGGMKVPLAMRIGINTGPVVAGIVGLVKFQYDIWGDAVNTASRMESGGEVGKVNISMNTYKLIKDEPEFQFESRGMVSVKGKGEIEMFFVSVKQQTSTA